MDANSIKNINEFLQLLKNKFDELRKTLDNLDDSQLLKSDDFKNCVKIANTILAYNNSKDARHAFYLIASDCDYNIDKFLDYFDVVLDKNNQIQIITKDETEQQDFYTAE
jgi:hypothetical protein